MGLTVPVRDGGLGVAFHLIAASARPTELGSGIGDGCDIEPGAHIWPLIAEAARPSLRSDGEEGLVRAPGNRAAGVCAASNRLTGGMGMGPRPGETRTTIPMWMPYHSHECSIRRFRSTSAGVRMVRTGFEADLYCSGM